MNRAIFYIGEKNYESSNNCLKKTQDIVNALRSVLDMDIPISKNLDSLYEFFNRQLIEANVKKDVEIIKELLPMFADLKDAFSQIANAPKAAAV